MMFPAIALMAQPSNSNSAGDPIATVQSGSWSEATTWDCGCVPSPANDVTVLASHTVTLNAGDTARAESLSMAVGSALMLPAEARVEVAASLASLGEIDGHGIVAFVGGGSQTCGPAKLGHLACGSGEVTFADTVTVTRQLDLEDANLETAGMLVLQGKSGITTDAGTITGQVHRRYTWEKTNSFNYLAGSGLSGTLAADFLNLPGAVYVKGWLEPSTAYIDMLPMEEMGVGQGHTCYLASGNYEYDIVGGPIMDTVVSVTAESENTTWKGWNLLSNPLTAFVDLNHTTLGGGEMGATYQWVDSLLTYVAHVGGVGQFGMSGVVEPGTAFWTVVDSSGDWSVPKESIVGREAYDNQGATALNSTLVLQVDCEDRVEQCVVDFGTGSAEYYPSEDAKFDNTFRGRNNLDVFSKSPNGTSLMINKTDVSTQIIPIWVKAFNGETVVIHPATVPEGVCLKLEDVVTGWIGNIEAGESYSFEATASLDMHRFNLIVGGSLEATALEASCASSLDGSIAAIGPGEGSTFVLLDEMGNNAGSFMADSLGGLYSELGVGLYTLIASSDGCADISKTVAVTAGESGIASFDIQAMPDHIGCYDDHGGVSLDIDGGLAPYTVAWSHGAVGDVIEVEAAGVLEAVITDAAGCSDSTSVEVLSAPQVEAGIALEAAVVTLVDGEAEVYFENASSGATAYQWNFGDGNASAAENPIHAYSAAGAYTVGLNAWNDYCSDTYQMVVTVETVSSVGDLAEGVEAAIERTSMGWQVRHPQEAFSVEVFDLTGRMVYMANGMPGSPVVLDPAVMPTVALVLWKGTQSGRQHTWRLAR
ncbi:MAG: PKD domain-containing protein [Flavobacteriales bacterium]|nr:PKD domain-containing protein [Flavobacteriales bacterium]